MPGKSTTTNLRRLYTQLQIPHEAGEEAVVVSLDAAKAFDSVEWGYLWEVMRRFGFGPNFIKWMRLLYSSPAARVSVNGCTTEPFKLARGTRQGCPLSPALFALAIEPLACMIRSHPHITGFPAGQRRDKIALYADDMLLFMTKVRESLPALLEVVDRFGTYSGLKINWDKSSLFPVGDLSPEKLPDTSPLQITTRFKYLGVWITPTPTQFAEQNLLPITNWFRAKIPIWTKLPLSPSGRVNLFKMVMLPKYLYILQHSPVFLPKSYFRAIDSHITSFIWANGRHKLAISNLRRPKHAGGLALPDLWAYYMAAQFAHLIPWMGATSEGTLIELLGHTEIGPLTPFQHLLLGDGNRQMPPIVIQAEKVWRAVRKLMADETWDQVTPIWGNKRLPQLWKLQGRFLWVEREVTTLGQLYTEGHLKSFSQLQEEFSLPHTLFYRYLQIRHALEAQFGPNLVAVQLSPTHSLLIAASRNKPISYIYSAIGARVHQDELPALKAKWETNVGQMPDEEWSQALASTKIATTSPKYQQIQLFILHRAYVSPSRLCKAGMTNTSTCPKCKQQDADFWHLVWECGPIQKFYGKVWSCISTFTPMLAPLHPKSFLFSINLDEDYSSTTYKMTGLLTSLARVLVARSWMAPKVPTFHNWVGLVNETMQHEQYVYTQRNNLSKFDSMWLGWTESPYVLYTTGADNPPNPP